MLHRRQHRNRQAAAALTFAILVAGCGSGGEPVSPSARDEQFAELPKRPDIEQVAQQCEQVLTLVRDRVAAQGPGVSWERKSEPGMAGCGFDFPDVDFDGATRTLPLWRSPGTIPDDLWGRVEALVGEVTRPYGFQGPAVVVNRPADHEVIFQDSYGAQLTIGTGKNTVLDLKTGCHLTKEAHQRGRPA